MSLAGATHVDSKAQTGLDWLLGARLVLAGMSLGLAVTIDRIEVDQDHPGIWGVYWTIVAAFTATIVSALMSRRTADPARFATLQVGFDVAIVTSLVYFSGASESVFTFLYALVILYGALVLDRGGVAFSSALAALGYGLVLFGSELGWLPAMGGPGRDRSLAIVGAYWGFLGGALLLLGMLANTLSAELRRTGAALDRRTTDLRRLRDLHQRTVESIGSGILTVDEQGRVTSFNPEAERITGLDASAATDRPLDSLIPGAWPFVLGESKAGIEGEGSIGRDRLAYRNARDEDLYLGLAHSKLRGEDGGSVGHVVIFQDVSAVVAMERDLRRSERLAAVGEMAARMAHEIRNPLASISGSVQVLQSRTDVVAADPEHEHLMGIVVREVDRLNGLISDFLRYSRPAPIKPEAVRLAALVEEIAEVSAGRGNGEVEVELDLDRSAVVLADPDQLRAVIWNLWNNALEAMGGAGRLSARVSLVPRDLSQEVSPADRNRGSGRSTPFDLSTGLAQLEIEDTGPGIEPDDVERLFEPFFTTKQDGTGLGLATVQRLVEQHGGTIEVISRSGEGTRFRVQAGLRGVLMDGTARARILVVDDEQSMREFLEIFLRREGYDVRVAPDVDTGLAHLENDEIDLVITDMQMPEKTGLDLILEARGLSPDTIVIVVTAFGTTDSAISAMKEGAYDYLTKPFKVDELRLVIEKALEKKILSKENRRLKQELRSQVRDRSIIGHSQPMQDVFDLIAQVAETKTNVLVSGESGTGKELVARAIHEQSDRASEPFIAINCGAIPENLLESELFGHAKGAFTGAVQNKQGLFEAAAGGTLFLDEIGELSHSLQVKLLRALQEKVIRRVGDTVDRKIDVRIVSATNRRLEEEVLEGRFREDLYYRLNVIQLTLPPLRERAEDIPVLAQFFLRRFADELGKDVEGMTPETFDLLAEYPFPGNVRELENLVERAVALARDSMIGPDLLPPTVTEARVPAVAPQIDPEGVDLDQLVADYERSLLVEALSLSAGVKKKAARLLGVSFRSFRYRLEKLGIEDPKRGD